MNFAYEVHFGACAALPGGFLSHPGSARLQKEPLLNWCCTVERGCGWDAWSRYFNPGKREPCGQQRTSEPFHGCGRWACRAGETLCQLKYSTFFAFLRTWLQYSDLHLSGDGPSCACSETLSDSVRD